MSKVFYWVWQVSSIWIMKPLADATVTCMTLHGLKLFKQIDSSVVLPYVVQIILAQPDKGPDRSKTLRVVLLLCNIWSFLNVSIHSLINLWLIQQNFRRETWLLESHHNRNSRARQGRGRCPPTVVLLNIIDTEECPTGAGLIGSSK